jgi:hypothetical protein
MYGERKQVDVKGEVDHNHHIKDLPEDTLREIAERNGFTLQGKQ